MGPVCNIPRAGNECSEESGPGPAGHRCPRGSFQGTEASLLYARGLHAPVFALALGVLNLTSPRQGRFSLLHFCTSSRPTCFPSKCPLVLRVGPAPSQDPSGQKSRSWLGPHV